MAISQKTIDMENDFSKRDPNEAKTHQLFHEFLQDKWSPNFQVIADVFYAKYPYALCTDVIENIAWAFDGYRRPLQRELTRLVRAKVLRSRVSKGFRLYEVNL